MEVEPIFTIVETEKVEAKEPAPPAPIANKNMKQESIRIEPDVSFPLNSEEYSMLLTTNLHKV